MIGCTKTIFYKSIIVMILCNKLSAINYSMLRHNKFTIKKEINRRNRVHKRRKVHMQILLLLLLITQQGQSMYAEEQREKFCFISCFHPQSVCVSSQRHIGGAQQLFCQLKSLVVLKMDGETLDGQRLAAFLYSAHLVR